MDISEKKQTNCRRIANKYLKNMNAGYRLRIPISFLIAIIVSIFMKKAISINNFFIAHILIPIATFLIVWFSIDIGVRNNISKEKLIALERKCNQVNNNNNNDIVNYKNKIMKEYFVSQEENIKENNNKNNNENKKEKVHNVADFISTDSHNLKTINQEPVLPKSIKCDSSSKDSDKYANPNTNYLNPTKRYYSNFPLGDTYPPPLSINNNLSDTAASGCLLGTDGCSPLCSGTGKNTCNLVVPVPGPQWQVQNASTVQYRINNNMFVPNNCSVGPTVLRDSPDCKNLDNTDTNCNDTNVKCTNSRMTG